MGNPPIETFDDMRDVHIMSELAGSSSGVVWGVWGEGRCGVTATDIEGIMAAEEVSWGASAAGRYG